jgi:predicted GIY-YIG superfamily endonuclease
VEEKQMHPRFAKASNSLDLSYRMLMKMKPVTIGTMPKDMPTQGVYLFSEGKKHLYVGRSNKLHKRPLRHCGTHRMAAFAFRLAREATGFIKPSYKSGGESRDGLMKNRRFVKEFDRAKERIRKMDLRFVEEGDQTRQVLLEIYCAVALKAPYNDFNTH